MRKHERILGHAPREACPVPAQDQQFETRFPKAAVAPLGFQAVRLEVLVKFPDALPHLLDRLAKCASLYGTIRVNGRSA